MENQAAVGSSDRREIGCGRIVLLYPWCILRSFKKYMCVCVGGGGGPINKWAIYMDVLSLHDEICTALLCMVRGLGPCMISIAGV